MNKKLDFKELLTNTITIGLKNFPSLIGCVVLWILTIWIPYVNVGTTIAIFTLPAALSKGKIISPLEIFNKKYFKFMGEYFLVTALKSIVVISSIIFLFIPTIVLSIAYSLSTLLVIDKGKGASEALNLSNKLTYGNKWTIFFANLVIGLAVFLVFWIFSKIAIVLGLLVLLLAFPLYLGFKANVYGQLAADVPEE